MRVLYIASNPDDARSLASMKEMNELQSVFSRHDGVHRVEFLPFPRLDVNRLMSVLRDVSPDVLHISAHSNGNALSLTDDAGIERAITNESFVDLVRNSGASPRLIYLNACTSQALAAALLPVAKCAVGTSAPITNIAARLSAARFYEWLASGSSVGEAWAAASTALKIVDPAVSLWCECQQGLSAAQYRLVRGTELLVYFPEVEALRGKRVPASFKLKPNGNDEFAMEIGLSGCPADLRQAVVFVDDETFIGEDEESLEDDLCWVTRDPPEEGQLWPEFKLGLYGDTTLYASITTATGKCYALKRRVIDALNAYYFVEKIHDLGEGRLQDEVRRVIAELRRGAGARGPAVPP